MNDIALLYGQTPVDPASEPLEANGSLIFEFDPALLPDVEKAHPNHKKTIRKLNPNLSQILELIAEGKSYRKIANKFGVERGVMISYLDAYFQTLHRRAMEIRAVNLVDDMLRIADDVKADVIKFKDSKGQDRYVANPSAVQRAKIQIDVRKWMAQVNNRKLYGDKVDNTLELTITPLQEYMREVIRKGSSIPVNAGRLIDNEDD